MIYVGDVVVAGSERSFKKGHMIMMVDKEEG